MKSLPKWAQLELLKSLTPEQKAQKLYDWTGWIARDNQLPPDGEWIHWLLLAGRGFGKTRTGAETVRDWIRQGYRYVNLIGATANDVRSIMVEGESGILAICPKDERPVFKAHISKLVWPNGAETLLFSAEEPERLRGKQSDKGWADEICSWKYKESWDQFKFGLRLGNKPQVVISTTPKPGDLLRSIVNDPSTVITRGSTLDNSDNLAKAFISTIIKKYEGTRLGRQELYAEVLEDVQGALWVRSNFDENRVEYVPELRRIVVSIDPSGARSEDDENADSIGIIVAGLGYNGRGYILADYTCKGSPAMWGRRAVEAYYKYDANIIIAERNFGGAMVEHVIRTTDQNVPYKDVTASRGKSVRAEPIAALYEQNRVSHIAGLDLLEDQLMAFTSNGYLGAGSPDRADSLVWALSELMLEEDPGAIWVALGNKL